VTDITGFKSPIYAQSKELRDKKLEWKKSAHMPYIIQNAEIEIHLFLYKDVLEHEKVIDQPTHSIQQKIRS
jgi:hypothetical protein